MLNKMYIPQRNIILINTPIFKKFRNKIKNKNKNDNITNKLIIPK